MSKQDKKINQVGVDFVKAFKSTDKKVGLNPENHNTATKRYAKLSLSLTNREKEQIREFKDKHYERMSISSMILSILEDAKVFDENV